MNQNWGRIAPPVFSIALEFHDLNGQFSLAPEGRTPKPAHLTWPRHRATHSSFQMTVRNTSLLLGTALLVTFMTGTASRIFAISLPSISAGLHTDMVGISWALISFQLSTAGLSLIFGRVGDVYGRETVYLWGIVLFTLSSLLCGFSQNITQLIVYRLLQGVAAAMIQAQGRALAMDASSDDTRGRAQGLMTTAHHSGFLFGPSLGGLILQYFHWRGIFFFLVPLGIVGTSLALLYHRRQREAEPVQDGNAPPQRIDYLGAVLLLSATLALIMILDQQVMGRMTLISRVGAILGFVALTAGFLIRESCAASPILSLALFKIRMFAFSTLCLLLLSIVMALTLFITPFYLQDILHLSPAFMGLLFMSAPVFAVTLSPLGGYIADKVGPKAPATAGALVFAVASGLGVFLETNSHWSLATFILILGGLGTALFFPANHTALIGAVPQAHRGVATGTLYTMFGLGNVFGITVGTFLMTAAFRIHTGVPEALPTAANPGAFVLAIQDTFLITTGIAIVGVICSHLRGR